MNSSRSKAPKKNNRHQARLKVSCVIKTTSVLIIPHNLNIGDFWVNSRTSNFWFTSISKPSSGFSSTHEVFPTCWHRVTHIYILYFAHQSRLKLKGVLCMTNYLTDKRVCYGNFHKSCLRNFRWLSGSPDLNPVDYHLWNIWEEKVCSKSKFWRRLLQYRKKLSCSFKKKSPNYIFLFYQWHFQFNLIFKMLRFINEQD